jgi:hypothetical protein
MLDEPLPELLRAFLNGEVEGVISVTPITWGWRSRFCGGTIS